MCDMYVCSKEQLRCSDAIVMLLIINSLRPVKKYLF